MEEESERWASRVHVQQPKGVNNAWVASQETVEVHFELTFTSLCVS